MRSRDFLGICAINKTLSCFQMVSGASEGWDREYVLLTFIPRGFNTLTLFWIYLCVYSPHKSYNNAIAPFPASIRPVTAPGVSEVRPGRPALLASQAARARTLASYQHSPCRGLPDRTDAWWIEFISRGNATTDTQACPEAAGETAPAARLWQVQSVDRLYACKRGGAPWWWWSPMLSTGRSYHHRLRTRTPGSWNWGLLERGCGSKDYVSRCVWLRRLATLRMHPPTRVQYRRLHGGSFCAWRIRGILRHSAPPLVRACRTEYIRQRAGKPDS